MDIVYLIAGLITGGIIAWLYSSSLSKSGTVQKAAYDELSLKLNSLITELSVEKEKTKTLTDNLRNKEEELKSRNAEMLDITSVLSARMTEITTFQKQLNETKEELIINKNSSLQLNTEIRNLERALSTAKANYEAAGNTLLKNTDDINQLKENLQSKTTEFNEANKTVADLSAKNQAMLEKLENQKTEIETLRKQFNTEFENIAAKILDEKTKKFTDLNKDNLETLLKPLGDNLKSFREKVEEVYDKESKERFSLGKEVEKLVVANQKISEEANNLTNALTSKSKTQGDWGQMILESILEKSGLVKGREYFTQEYLKDEQGNYLVNEEGTKMQPDVIMVYPDNRKVLVDSKVSLTAYNRYTSTSTKEDETKSLAEHLKSVRKHIDDLSSKNYQDFAPTLDFVMMFVPIEPAYLLAIHTDQDLWTYAYNKRILLTSPSNLIVALKMVVDLWKRDNQNKNHQAIVDRGGKLYDKFSMVLTSLNSIGSHLRETQKSYNAAVSQLSEGNDNVLKQVEKLKTLGAKAKKTLPQPDSLPLFEESDNDMLKNEQ